MPTFLPQKPLSNRDRGFKDGVGSAAPVAFHDERPSYLTSACKLLRSQQGTALQFRCQKRLNLRCGVLGHVKRVSLWSWSIVQRQSCLHQRRQVARSCELQASLSDTCLFYLPLASVFVYSLETQHIDSIKSIEFGNMRNHRDVDTTKSKYLCAVAV